MGSIRSEDECGSVKALIEAKDKQQTQRQTGEALTALQTAHDRLVKLNSRSMTGRCTIEEWN
ncbi:MAG: hypothetical protein ACLU6F_12435 [[Ruminococcus] torques]